MAEIDFLLLEQRQIEDNCKKNTKRWRRVSPVRLQEELWHGFVLRIHWMPSVWLQYPDRIQNYVDKFRMYSGQLWTDSGLDPFLKEEKQPLPSALLASWILKCQPFRQIMILHYGRMKWEQNGFWIEHFLRESYRELNGLYLVGTSEVDADFLEQIYEETGLVTTVTGQLPDVDGKKCVFVDLEEANLRMMRRIPAGCIYLDLTSDREKQRYFAVKRQDISDILARNFLDTALKARYNAF